MHDFDFFRSRSEYDERAHLARLTLERLSLERPPRRPAEPRAHRTLADLRAAWRCVVTAVGRRAPHWPAQRAR